MSWSLQQQEFVNVLMSFFFLTSKRSFGFASSCVECQAAVLVFMTTPVEKIPFDFFHRAPLKTCQKNF